MVYSRGYHNLSYKKARGRVLHHKTLNVIKQHCLTEVGGVPCVKEPAGLSGDDGRRSDGMILTPWHSGPLVWGVTIVNSVAESCIGLS
jgi:hypothetical protein